MRPSFFCGQLLTDADLDALVDWSRSRFSLTRHRDGWGVVCGLDVTCAGPSGASACGEDAGAGPAVWVQPGYAIDACGNDLVVGDAIAVDLGEVCRVPEDLCEEPGRPAEGVAAKRVAAERVLAARAVPAAEAPRIVQPRPPPQKPPPQKPPPQKPPPQEPPPQKPPPQKPPPKPEPPPNPEPPPHAHACYQRLGDSMIAVDLTLRYHEDVAQGQRPMFRGRCSDLASCEYARVLERPYVQAEVGDLARTCAGENGWDAWYDAFKVRQWEMVERFEKLAAQGGQELVRHLRQHPPYRFCFLEDLVCCLMKDEKAKDEIRLVGYWLYLDSLLRAIACSCPSGRQDQGVPIARVLLRRPEEGDAAGARCKVLMVDTSPLHRRLLRKDPCHPMPPGAIDLAPYYWQPWAVAQRALRGVVFPSVRTISIIEAARSMGDLVAPALWYEPGVGELAVLLLVDPFGCERVALFEARM